VGIVVQGAVSGYTLDGGVLFREDDRPWVRSTLLFPLIFTLGFPHSTIRHLDIERLRDNYNIWGPSARTCISVLTPHRLDRHILAVISAANYFTRHFDQFDDLDAVVVFHQLYVVRPTHGRQGVNCEICIGAPPCIRLTCLYQARSCHAAEFLQSDEQGCVVQRVSR
jgi:hypothetical protein